MAATSSADREFEFDAFISYSRADTAFAEKLEQALESYTSHKA